jgi:hypothetical protein
MEKEQKPTKINLSEAMDRAIMIAQRASKLTTELRDLKRKHNLVCRKLAKLETEQLREAKTPKGVSKIKGKYTLTDKLLYASLSLNIVLSLSLIF